LDNISNNNIKSKIVIIISIFLITSFSSTSAFSQTQNNKVSSKKSVLDFVTPTPEVKLFKSVSNESGTIVSVGQSGVIWVTKDKEKWNIADSGTHENLYNIVWAFNKFIAVGANGTIISSVDGTKWDKINFKQKIDLYNISYVNGNLFLYSAQGGFIFSDNGIDFKDADTGISANKKIILRNIIYDGKEYIAVFNGMINNKNYADNLNPVNLDINDTESYIAVSKELKIWKIEKYTSALYNIATNCSQNVVIGYNTILTSHNGDSWRTAKIQNKKYNGNIIFDSILCNGSRFTVLGMSNYTKGSKAASQVAANSVDGENFIISEYDNNRGYVRNIESFILDGSKYVFLSHNYSESSEDTTLWYSRDGARWISVNFMRDQDMYMNFYRYSPESYDIKKSTRFTSACYDNKTFILTSEAGLIYTCDITNSETADSILTIKNTQIKTSSLTFVENAFFDGKEFVSFLSTLLTNPDKAVYLSRDGVNWSASKNGVQPTKNINSTSNIIGNMSNNNFDLAWDGKKFVVVDPLLGNLVTSTNLIDQSQISYENYFDSESSSHKTDGFNIVLPNEYKMKYLSYFNNKYIATVIYDSSRIALSNDGVKWKIEKTNINKQGGMVYGVTVGNNNYVIVYNDAIYSSKDCKKWTKFYSLESNLNKYHAFYCNNSYFVSAGSLIYESNDTKKWTKVFSGAKDKIINNIKWDGNRFIAVGNAGTILTSMDGNRWRAEKSPTHDDFVDVAAGNGKIIVISKAGRVVTASN
jgi:hypothetical protein